MNVECDLCFRNVRTPTAIIINVDIELKRRHLCGMKPILGTILCGLSFYRLMAVKWRIEAIKRSIQFQASGLLISHIGF